MSPAWIVTLIIAGIVVMVGAAFIAQSVENARKERLRKISIINERIRHLSGIVSDIPNNYMTADLRLFVIGLLRKNYSAIIALDARHSSAKVQLQQLEEQAKQPFTSELDSLKAPFNDTVTGQGIRARIKDLVNIIVAMNKDGSLDKPTAVKYVNQGKMMFELVTVDITLISARTAEQGDKNIKAAAVHYSSCLKKLLKINSQGQFNKRLNHMKSKLQQLQEKLKAQTAQDSPAPEEQDEWSKFKSDNDDWKIKQDYE
ncbi:MAG: hypothetical protein V7752_20195 [Halopseudomonas sp.]